MPVDAARVKSLFLATSDLADPAARAAYLDRECGGDAELRDRVEALLRANDAAPLPPAKAEDGTSAQIPDRRQRTEEFGDPTARVGSILAGKYKLIEEIGEGGMGSVYLAQQTEPVKRAVAVKVIKAGMDSKAVLTRFEAERQALAMMDHPNIAKVLDAGTTDGGRPFFVMELVKGLPITRYCDERKLTPRQRLELFVPVCQAIQHAHQKGVIHRDIKPSNVLVAMYDDRAVPKVIDFGVAKAAGQTLTDKTLMTGFGAVVGTAEYMSPEQANLNNLDIDTRSDVYSLGVLLYELLTGTTPVDRKSLGKAALLEILRIVREVDVLKPSAKLSTIDTLPSVAANRGTEPKKLSKLLRGELDWLVLKALEKDRTRRYETANALARDVQRYLADEIVEARRPSAGYRLKKFMRRNPLQLALAGTVALLLLSVGAVVWWQNEQAGARRETDLRRRLEDEQRLAADNARLARNAEAVAALLDQSEEALRAGDAAKAAVALEAARKRSAEGGAEQEAQRLRGLHADLTLVRDLNAVDQFRWTPAENQLPSPAFVATRTREALARFGADPETVSVDDAAARVTASVVRERIVAALDRLLRHWRRAQVRALLQRVDADEYRDAVRDVVLANDAAKMADLAGQLTALEQPPGFVAFLGESGAITMERRRQLLAAALGRRPGDLSLLMTLGYTYPIDQVEGANERLRWFQAAVAAAPGNAAAHHGLGIALHDKKDLTGAEAAFRKAAALDPKAALTHYSLGNALSDKGQLDEAIACYQQAIELDPKFAMAHSNLGNALRDKGQVDAAIVCYQKAIELDAALVPPLNNLGGILCDLKRDYDGAFACFQKTLVLDPKNAAAHLGLGNVLGRQGKLDEKLNYCRKAIELDPKFARAHASLGAALADKGQVDAAISCYEKAIALDPKDATVHNGLGAILCDDRRDYDGAMDCFRKALALDPKLAPAHSNLGTALRGKGQLDEAIACYEKAIALDPKDALTHDNLGLALSRKGQVDEAIACFQKALALDPKYAMAHNNLGYELARKGQVDEAIACFKRAIGRDPRNAAAHLNLGSALGLKGQVDKAIACYKNAIALDPRNAAANYALANALAHKGQLDQAIGCFQKAIELQPNYAEAYCNLGGALKQQGRFAESLAAVKRGHELGMEQPGWRYPSAEWVRDGERLVARQDRLLAFLKGKYQPKDTAERLDLIGICLPKKFNAAAARLLTEAFAADPKLADDLSSDHRYNAACFAALAAAGQGEDAAKLDDKERTRLRKQALDWLRADLAARREQLATGKPTNRAEMQTALRHWQMDPDLASIRDAATLTKLPVEEQKAFTQLWADVAALLKKAEEKPPATVAPPPEKK